MEGGGKRRDSEIGEMGKFRETDGRRRIGGNNGPAGPYTRKDPRC